jgi:hypothetical protein
VKSAISAPSSRLWSRSLVVGAAQSTGRSRARLEPLARWLGRVGGGVLRELGLGVLQLRELLLPAILEAAGDQPIFWAGPGPAS